MSPHKETVRTHIDLCLKVIRMYEWLLDLYVLDFFVDDHWNKLPLCWRECFEKVDPQQLGHVLCGKQTPHVYPLSFLALINTIKALTITRERDTSLNSECETGCIEKDTNHHPNLKNLFLKHIKMKKRHEISVMAGVVKNTASRSVCSGVIDFGSGLGHLVRMLAYKYDLSAAGIECQTQLTEEARKLDLELEYTASKHLSATAMSKLKRPIHLNMTLTDQHQLLDVDLPETLKNYGLVGLHPCGDLGPLLLKHLAYNEQVKFICVVGCCYMKLSKAGYPMSNYLSNLHSDISYVSREIACHAIEVYLERLLEGKFENLKIHAYRAALEALLVEHNPKLKHAPVRSIKHSDTMTFERYCSLAIDKLNIPLPTSPVVWARGEALLRLWRRVVTVYTLRLALAPLVETLILLDRVLFVLERDISCEIHPVFDPKLSPRNHIIIARK